jgi:uncharacterized protein YrrD
MIPARSLENKALISITNGKKIAQVKDVYLDAEAARLVAVLLGHEGLLHRKTMIIDRASIAVFGIDVWLAMGPDVVTKMSRSDAAAAWIAAGSLRGHAVTTDGGTKIGAIEDVLLDENMKVAGFVLGKLQVKGPLAVRKYIARSAVKNTGLLASGLGGRPEPIIIDLAKAEAVELTS